MRPILSFLTAAVLAAGAMSMAAPSRGAEIGTALDQLLTCGAAFLLAAEEGGEEADKVREIGFALLTRADTILTRQGVSEPERQTIGGEYVRKVGELFDRGAEPAYSREVCLELAQTEGFDVQAGAEGAATPALADPGNLTAYRGQNGTQLRFTVTGDPSSAVWGDQIFTDDSALATAAIHAGVLQPGQTGVVTVEILPGQASYAGIVRNGVSSNPYGSFQGSFRFIGAPAVDPNAPQPDPGSLTGFRQRTGEQLRFQVTGNAAGSVWGDGIYTDDSRLATAAVHAGVLREGETGVVIVEMLPGQADYAGATRNGISSDAYGSFSGSFRFVEEQPAPQQGKSDKGRTKVQ